MSLRDQLNDDSLRWLLEEESPGVRYLATRDLLEYPANYKDLITPRNKAHTDGPIADILNQMNEEGFWKKAGPGYLPKYWSTVWSVITLDTV